MRLLIFMVGMLFLTQTHAQCVDGSCDDGVGTYLFANGSKYSGEFANGLPDGQGLWEYPKGGKIKGLFKAGIPVGEDVFAKASTPRQKGCISGNCHHGVGIFVQEDGSRYVGYFKRNKPSGKGTQYYPNGDRFDGYWKDGLPNGQGTLYKSNEEIQQGDWKNGKLNISRIIEEHSLNDGVFHNRYAVVIGIANYEKMGLLDYSDDDAYNFYSFLEQKKDANILENDIRFLIDENASAKDIREAIKEVAHKAGPNDEIIIYYSGHGVNQAIIPYESDGQTGLLTHQEINQILETSSATKMFYFDACNTEFSKDLNLESTYDMSVFYSSSPGENSLESNELKQGVFSFYLIQGLNGAADTNGDDFVSEGELSYYVSTNVENYTNQKQYPILVSRNK